MGRGGRRQLAGSYLWLKKKKSKGKKSSPRVQGASRLNVGCPMPGGVAGEGVQSDLPPPPLALLFPLQGPSEPACSIRLAHMCQSDHGCQLCALPVEKATMARQGDSNSHPPITRDFGVTCEVSNIRNYLGKTLASVYLVRGLRLSDFKVGLLEVARL